MTPMTLDEVHAVLYDILVDIHEFCVENDIKYSLAGGTLLGAIRHNGFIPWDDDIDVQMSRPEYERFIHSYRSKRGYRLFCREVSGGEDVEVAFTRVCEMEKTYVDTGAFPWKKESTGLWVDVVPIDGAPDNRREAMWKIRKMYFLWYITLAVRHTKKATFGSTKGVLKKIKYIIKKCLVTFISKELIVKYINLCQEYSYNKYSYIANYSTMQNKFREWQPKKTMESFVLHRFENGEFFIMEDFETSLKSLYGNYMIFPPKEKQIAHINNLYYWK